MDTNRAPCGDMDPEAEQAISYRATGASRVSGLSTSTIKRAMADGSLRSRKIGGCRIILREDLERFLREAS